MDCTNKILLLKNKISNSLLTCRLIFGLENGLVVVDYLSKLILMNMATPDLYGTTDPFQRASLSLKHRGLSSIDSNNDGSNASTFEYQVNYESI